MKNQHKIEINEAAWQEHRRLLYAFVLKRVHDQFIAEDITQDVLLRVYIHLDSLSSSEKFLAWLYQIARNAIADYFRRSQNETEISTTIAAPEVNELQSAYEELAPCLLPLIQQLPETYQSAITDSEIHNIRQKDYAEKSGLSLSAAKSRVQRGRKLLRELLYQCCRFEVNAAGNLLDYQPKTDCRACSTESCEAS